MENYNPALCISKEVFIRRKPMENGFINANKKTFKDSNNIYKIGSSMTATGAIVRGLTLEEQPMYLPTLIGVGANDPAFVGACDNYWSEISVLIPIGNGKKLETGFVFKSIEKKEEAEKELNNDFKGNYWTVCEKHGGIPIELGDYILYRYCLNYSRVANNISDINKSNKIRFYIYTKENEITTKHIKFQIIRNANAKLLEVFGDRQLVNLLIAVYERYEITDDREKDIFLQEQVNLDPSLFLSYVNDSDLNMRAFINKCISRGLLSKLPNTESICCDDIVIGRNIPETISQLKSDSQAALMVRLQAQLKSQFNESLENRVKSGKEFLVGNQNKTVPTNPDGTPKVIPTNPDGTPKVQ